MQLVITAHTFASDRQLLFLNQQVKKKNDHRSYFISVATRFTWRMWDLNLGPLDLQLDAILTVLWSPIRKVWRKKLREAVTVFTLNIWTPLLPTILVLKFKQFAVSKIDGWVANSMDPDQICILQHLIWVCTVGPSYLSQSLRKHAYSNIPGLENSPPKTENFQIFCSKHRLWAASVRHF